MVDLENANQNELSQMKIWLFQENIRIQNERQKLDEDIEAFKQAQEDIKKQFLKENREIRQQQDNCMREQKLIDEKWKLLKKGFDELDEDRRILKRQEQRLLEYKKEIESLPVRSHGSVTVFFRGVNDTLSLKKRYRDLLKIFHPDNLAGDKETVLSITQEYDNLRLQFRGL